MLNDIDQQGLESVLTEVGKGKGRAVVGDVAQEETARSLAQEAVSAFGHIDVLVNNAGVFFDKDITDMTVEEWDRLMDVNLKSMFLCCKHVIPQMLRQKKGSIVNLASISSFIGMEMEGVSTFAYCITKAGALQLTKSLTTRYAAEGIRVNCVCPVLHRDQCPQTPRHPGLGGRALADSGRCAAHWTSRPTRGGGQCHSLSRLGRSIVRDWLSPSRRWGILGAVGNFQRVNPYVSAFPLVARSESAFSL